MSLDFVNLHTHSYYTILEAPFPPKQILERALEMGHSKVALTDKGCGYGLIEFYMAAGKLDGIEPILGVEIAVSMATRFEKRPGIDGNEGTVVLLAKDMDGYKNLLKIISIASLEGFYHQPRIDIEILEKHSAGLYCLTGGRDGLVGKKYFDHGEDQADQIIEQLVGIFGKERFYLELVSRSFEEQTILNKWIVEVSQKKLLELVATSDARFSLPKDESASDVFWCIGKNQNMHDPTRNKGIEGNWFKSWEEIQQELAYVPSNLLDKARENTLIIANSCNVEIGFGNDLLPKFEVPEGENEASWLRVECENKIEFRYAEDFARSEEMQRKKETEDEDIIVITPQVIKDRLDYELSVIGNMGFDAYFLIVADFIQYAKEQGIFVGPGRGSAAGSLVAYLLEITNIDPIGYELLFERFLNPERVSMPDIDIDFSDERREEVMDYVVEKYGTEQVSKVCTFGTLAAKAALKDVGRAMGIDYGRMNAMTKALPNKPGFKLSDAGEVKDFMELVDKNADLRQVFEIASHLEGSVRHVSVHACAVIIGNSDLSDNTPVQWAPGTEDVKITQYPYQQLESLGLLKMDFLGLKNLSILEKTLNHIEATTGREINLNDLPIDDRRVFEMMSEGETTGVFQFESAGMRRYLRELRPTELEDLVAMNALYRPGPMEYIPQYIKGKHDPNTVKYPNEVLKPILRKTYGIAVYQEQVLRIAQDFSGFTLGEADILRKAIGKKIHRILEEQRIKFIEGAIEKGHTEAEAAHLFDDIVVPFAGYGFNRSHAVCYARIAYETAYMRANYPVEFMAATMTTDRNNTERIVLEMNECVDMGIEVLPPSVNESGSHFTVILGTEEEQEQADASENFYRTHGKKIRFGLTAIKGLGEETADMIIQERESGGRFESLQELSKRLPAKLMNKKTLEALSFSGALDEFGNRGAIVASLEELAKFAKENEEKEQAGQIGLFGGIAEEESIDFHLPNIIATKDEILSWERESLGLFVSDHPLKGLGEYFAEFGKLIGGIPEEEEELKAIEEARIEAAKEAAEAAGEKYKKGRKKKEKRVVIIHGMVSEVRKITTKSGTQMAVMMVEDTSGKIECAVFPRVFEGCPAKAFELDAFLRIEGRPEERDGAYNFIVDTIKVGNLKQVQEKYLLSEENNKQEVKIEKEPSIKVSEIGIEDPIHVEPVIENTGDDGLNKTADAPEIIEEQVVGACLKIEIPIGASPERITEFKQEILALEKGEGVLTIVVDGKDRVIPFGVNLESESFQNLQSFFDSSNSLEF